MGLVVDGAVFDGFVGIGVKSEGATQGTADAGWFGHVEWRKWVVVGLGRRQSEGCKSMLGEGTCFCGGTVSGVVFDWYGNMRETQRK